MAIAAIYQHHERTTTVSLEADLQLREIGIDPQAKFLVAYSESLGTKLHAVTQESPTVQLAGELSVTGQTIFIGATTCVSIAAATFLSAGTTLSCVGNFSVNTNKFTVAAASGNTVAAGTFTSVSVSTGLLELSDNIQVSDTSWSILGTTVNGSDTATWIIAPNNSGGDVTRSGYINMRGNDNGGAGAGGYIRISAGNETTGTIILATGNDVARLTIAQNGNATFSGGLTLSSTLTCASDVTFTDSDWNFLANTSDASDTYGITINAGGAVRDTSRGAYINLRGNENGGAPGVARMSAGNVSGGTVVLATGADVARLTIDETGTTTLSSIAGTGTRLVTSTSTGVLGNATTIAGNYTFSGTLTLSSTITASGLSASQAVFTDASKNFVSRGTTGTAGSTVVLSVSPTLTGSMFVDTITCNGSSSGYIGVGTGASVNVAIYLAPTLSGSTFQYALINQTIFDATATNAYSQFNQFKAATGAAVTSGFGIYIESPSLAGSATVATMYALRVADQTAATTNYAIYTGSGLVRFGGAVTAASTLAVTGMSTFTGNIAVGGSPASSTAINIQATLSGGTFQYALVNQSTFGSDATSQGVSQFIQFKSTAATFTMNNGKGIYVASPSIGAGNTVTNIYGIHVDNQTGGGTNYALYTGTGLVRFGDAVTMASSASITNGLTLTNDLIYTTSAQFIRANTSDGADNKAIHICGGDTNNVTRGGYISINGNEAAAPGDVTIVAGTVTGGGITLNVNGSDVFTVGQNQINTFSTAVSLSSTLAVTGTTAHTGNVGIGGSSDPAFGLVIASTGLTGAFQFGLVTYPIFSGTLTQVAAHYCRLRTTGATTMTTGIGFAVDVTSLGATTVTTVYGIKVENQTGGGTNYSIYTGTGLVRFGDAVTATSTLAVTGITSLSSTLSFVANGSTAAASIFKTSISGLVIRGGDGGTYDLRIQNNLTDDILLCNNDSTVLTFPGTANTFAGTVAVTGTLANTGGLFINGTNMTVSSAGAIDTVSTITAAGLIQGYLAVAAVSGTSVSSYGVGEPGDTNTEFIAINHDASKGTIVVGKTGSGTYHDLELWTSNTAQLTITAAGVATFASTLNVTGLTSLLYGTGTTAGGSIAVKFGSTQVCGLVYGSGAPTVSAPLGALYLRTDGSGTNNRAYINTDGGTTWTAIVTVA